MRSDIIAEAIRDPKFVARFWSKVEHGPGCWIWQGSTKGRRYGAISRSVNKRKDWFQAHLIALCLERGSVPAAPCVLHECDNPKCCRPSHLRPGTQADNVADMYAKGRNVNRGHVGTSHPMAKLTDEQVLDIRARLAEGYTQLSLARTFGVCQTAISHIKTGRSWPHLL